VCYGARWLLPVRAQGQPTSPNKNEGKIVQMMYPHSMTNDELVHAAHNDPPTRELMVELASRLNDAEAEVIELKTEISTVHC